MSQLDDKPLVPEPDAEEPIEGGTITELERELPFEERQHRAEAAKKLAFLLTWILAGSVALQYIATIVFLSLGKNTGAEELARIFNVWLPVISSLVSAAATYYFTKER